MMQQIGKMVFIVGLACLAIGGLLYLLGRLGVGRLPGDISFGGRGWSIYLPIGTSILLSIILTLILYILARLPR